jgi:GNAT superfamily N-acetyltransferase
MRTPWVIRPVRPDEHDIVGELVVRAFSTIYDDLGDYEAVIRDVGDRAASAEVLVAELGGSVVGTVTYVSGPGPYAEGPDPDAAWIRMLAVDPDHEGRGLGTALSLACVERARADGRQRVLLNTGDPQLTAHRLYQRLGFARRPDLDVEVERGFWLRAYALELT